MKIGIITNTLKFYCYFGQYQIWAKISNLAVHCHQKYYPQDAVTNTTDDIVIELTRNVSRYATKKAHTCRTRYENIGERIIENG